MLKKTEAQSTQAVFTCQLKKVAGQAQIYEEVIQLIMVSLSNPSIDLKDKIAMDCY